MDVSALAKSCKHQALCFWSKLLGKLARAQLQGHPAGAKTVTRISWIQTGMWNWHCFNGYGG